MPKEILQLNDTTFDFDNPPMKNLLDLVELDKDISC